MSIDKTTRAFAFYVLANRGKCYSMDEIVALCYLANIKCGFDIKFTAEYYSLSSTDISYEIYRGADLKFVEVSYNNLENEGRQMYRLSKDGMELLSHMIINNNVDLSKLTLCNSIIKKLQNTSSELVVIYATSHMKSIIHNENIESFMRTQLDRKERDIRDTGYYSRFVKELIS